MIRLLLMLLILCGMPQRAFSLSMEENSDGTTRTLSDYIKDYVDVPKGATDWKILGATKETEVKKKTGDGYDLEYTKPKFTQQVRALDGKEILLKGFMFPLEGTEKQKTFLFGPFPLSCPFHYHVQPSLVVEVHSEKKPVKFSYDPVTLKGRLELVEDDPEYSTFYRLKDAEQVKEK